jgi:hypothetical protein
MLYSGTRLTTEYKLEYNYPPSALNIWAMVMSNMADKWFVFGQCVVQTSRVEYIELVSAKLEKEVCHGMVDDRGA